MVRPFGVFRWVACSHPGEDRLHSLTAQRVPVVAGVLSPRYAEAMRTGRDLTKAGADALLLLAPFYVKPSQDGIRDYFRAFRNDVDAPLVFYDVPYRTSIATDSAVITDLASDGTVIGIKACETDLHHFNQIVAWTDAGFAILSGEDTMFPAQVALGASGGIPASASLLPAYWVRVFEDAVGGKLPAAVKAPRRLLPLLAAMFAEANPGVLTEAMNLSGIPCRHALPPLRFPSDATMAALRTALNALRDDGLLH